MARAKRSICPYVVGLDLSLTCPGVCIIPTDWGHDLRRVQVHHATVPVEGGNDACRANRLVWIESWLTQFIKEGRMFAIESLPSHGAFAIGPLGELHGVVRRRLFVNNCEVRTAPLATARKLLMGKLPQKDQKTIVRSTVQSFDGSAHWTGDECDAFVVANWLCAELGAPFLSALNSMMSSK